MSDIFLVIQICIATSCLILISRALSLIELHLRHDPATARKQMERIIELEKELETRASVFPEWMKEK